MTLSNLKNKFKTTLHALYPSSEISSIFRYLVKHKLDLNAAEIVLEGNKEVKATDLDFFLTSLNRLQSKEPIQYIIGEANFYNSIFEVSPDVLIPRPETEELVAWIIDDIALLNSNKILKVLDIGTGSGCIAISIAKYAENVAVSAIDFSKKALHIAERNALSNKVNIQFLETDILNAQDLPEKYDIIVSNPPYVREKEKEQMHDNVLKHEPDEALFVTDENPLLFYDKISDLAKKSLVENGVLYFEINQYLGKEIKQLLETKGFERIELRKDFLEKDRMIKAFNN